MWSCSPSGGPGRKPPLRASRKKRRSRPSRSRPEKRPIRRRHRSQNLTNTRGKSVNSKLPVHWMMSIVAALAVQTALAQSPAAAAKPAPEAQAAAQPEAAVAAAKAGQNAATAEAAPQAATAGSSQPGEPIIQSRKDKISYAFGADLARDLRRQKDNLNVELLVRALTDALAGRSLIMTDEEVAATVKEFDA